MPHVASDLDRLLITMDVAVQSFAVCEINPGFRLVGTPVDAIMVHYVLAGTMHMTVEGHPPMVCGPGCVALLPPGAVPRMEAAPGAEIELNGGDHTHLRGGLLVMDAADGGVGELRIVAGLVMASVSGSFGLLDKLREPISEDLRDLDLVRDSYSLMLHELTHPGLGSGALVSSMMKTCLLLVLRRYFARNEGDSSVIGALVDPRLSAAVAAVLERPAHAHTVASLADRAAMSRSTFARTFVDAFALSPMEFVAKTRLRHAADMLRSTQLPIKVIAASTGFSSRSHFSKAFRIAYGLDPSSYREKSLLAALDAPAPLHGSRSTYGLAEEPAV